MSNQKETVNAKQKGIIVIIVAFAVLLAALVICIVLLFSKKDSGQQAEVPADTENSAAAAALDRGFVDEDSADEIMSEMTDKVAEGMFECKMSTSWTFKDGSSESPNSYVANVESNLHTLYFDVYERDTNEKLYSSPMLPVGTDISNIKLDKELSAGEYDAVVMYTLVDENYEEVSTVGFNITISVMQ